MKKIILQLILVISSSLAIATTIEVKQDGTGDYISIQEAIDATMPYDTVLVYPGTYYENLIIEDNNIWLGSLSLTTGDVSYRNTTIIDGNQNGSCIAVLSSPGITEYYINGFTIQNGTGTEYYNTTYGGGIYIERSNEKDDNVLTVNIDNCIIKDNSCTDYGGGICIYFESKCNINNCIIKNNRSKKRGGGGIAPLNKTSLFLSGTTITENHAHTTGGGLIYGYKSTIVFDWENRCSVYNNTAFRGCDINKSSSIQSTIYLDTATVFNPRRYFIYNHDINGFVTDEGIVIDVLHGWIEPVDDNLYVNPALGNDLNSGLSADSALKTLTFALKKIAIDSLDPNTIHLANGIYSDTVNGEKFPLGLRQFVNIEGSSMDSTILDGEYKSFIFRGNNEISDYKLSKMTMQRGNDVDYTESSFFNFGLAWLYMQGENIILDSIIFKEGWSEHGYEHLSAWTGNNLLISNCQFIDNIAGAALGITGDSIGDTLVVNNCVFKGHRPDYNHPQQQYVAEALSFGGSQEAVSIATNCLFVDNEDLSYTSLFGNPLTFDIHHNYLVNCTFSDNSNSPDLNGWSFWIAGSHNHFYNCIIYSEGQPQLFLLANHENLGKTHLDIYNSLVQTGEDAIYADAGTTYYYDTATNIDADPIFLGMWDHPYMIADGSPCINTGTLANLPDFIVLPETDLAGNPRIVGDSIDMGCYEWNPTIVGFNEIGPGSEKEKPKLLKASPNPFGSSTRISIKYKSEETVKVEIYDSFGHRVKTMLNSSLSQGNYELKWDGTDNNGNHLPQGVYFVIMFSGEKEVESLKVVKR